jgi:hypothetical protein
VTESISLLKKRIGCRRVGFQGILIILLAVWAIFIQIIMLFQEPEAQTIGVSAFVCGLTTVTVGVGVYLLRRWWSPSQLHGCVAGFLFILIGSLGAVWAETVYWAFEKIFGAQGVAAHPNLIIDLLVTMPWYISMVAVLWLVHRRFRYHWTTVALLGVLYETAGDGIFGHLAGGNAITLEYLFQLLIFFPGIFLFTYAPIVLPSVWVFPMDDAPYTGPRWKPVAGALLPLLPLIPYGLTVIILFAP